MHVLIVEDEVKMAALIRRGLGEQGLTADVASTGEDALVMAGSSEYDAIVLDVILPGIDGFATCRRRQDRDPALRQGVRSPRSVHAPPRARALAPAAASTIHGDESAGTAIARRLASGAPPPRAMLWMIKDVNPDGVAAGTRQNADGVDLNRNFPWRWRRLDHRGDPQYSGPHPLSEPEARAAHALILRVRPNITIWFHQPLGLVDESGGDVRVERRFARLSGLPLRRLTRYPGSAAGWQNHRLTGSTAFVVELPSRLSDQQVRRDSHAVRQLAA
jgi:Response regulators consisting of a CheY-like receiver domain and a winged-helix DNA-binding domain